MALFVVQPARIAFYVGYFALGIYAERRGWFRVGGFRPELGPWGWGAVVTGMFYLGLRMGGLADSVPVRVFESALFSLFCLEAVIGGVALFRLVVDSAGPGWRMVAGNS